MCGEEWIVKFHDCKTFLWAKLHLTNHGHLCVYEVKDSMSRHASEDVAKLDMETWKAIMHQKPFSVINALWPWPLDAKMNRAHPQLMGVSVSSFTIVCVEGKPLLVKNYFQKQMQCDLDFWTWKSTGHILFSWVVCVWFHNSRCKGIIAIMHQKPFSITISLWPWSFEPKNQ